MLFMLWVGTDPALSNHMIAVLEQQLQFRREFSTEGTGSAVQTVI